MMMLSAEILAVGTELLLGSIANTNAQMISRSLSGLGVNVFWHTVVGDNPGRLEAALDIARKRADVIITVGGLGPTYDDLTKEIVCRVFGRRLTFRADIAEELRTLYETVFRVPMPENNFHQAELPEGSTVFDNPVGTAPGCAFYEGGVHVLMLPGPPEECEAMLHRHAEPYLRGLSDEIILSHDILCFGIGESAVDQLLREKMSCMKNPSLATYAKPAEMCLRVTAKAKTRDGAEAMLDPVVDEVKKALGDVVYGVDVSSLEEACKKLLQEQGLSLATAESCTGGLLAQRMTELPGVSAVYRGGVVSYWTSVKADVLGVPWALLDEFGAVSEPVARAMAEGVCSVTGAELGISVTGVAGPGADERGNPVGLVYLGLCTPEGTFCRKLTLGRRKRERIRALAANTGLDMVRRYLTGLPLESARET